ncbi:hypothetical protein AVEN_216436-1 [Araneus ventricosus]|uniref:Uncharacterized protein n=1 Tax=Araneus ventricosus TaxID=182803 RepID=A0A4Y2BPF4_ARAVE|nr:hypothetical protein AVEN_216436-1 [Araneus ventricosus]
MRLLRLQRRCYVNCDRNLLSDPTQSICARLSAYHDFPDASRAKLPTQRFKKIRQDKKSRQVVCAQQKSSQCKMFTIVWLNALKATNAPVNDLMLWECLNKFEKFDHGVVLGALLTFSRHLWYLTGEAATFSLFSKKMSESEKNISAF